MIREVSPTEWTQFLAANPTSALVIDVREDFEVAQGKLVGAVWIRLANLADEVERRQIAKAQPLLLYCAAGRRSLIAAQILEKLGFADLRSLQGGMGRWLAESRPIEAAKECAPLQGHRYQRQMILPEVGSRGQVKLANSKVLIVGAGGLGSSAAIYLAAAGVGQLGLVDFDKVELSNLHRQILHSNETIGQQKVVSAKAHLQRLNPQVKVETYAERITAQNAESLVANYDCLIDATDNFEARQAIATAAVKSQKPLFYGAVQGFQGQVALFHSPHGPCYRCLFAEAPPPHIAPTCAEAGVLGVVPGLIGTLQATEVLKWLLAIGEPLLGRLMLYNALTNQQQLLAVARDPNCPLCAERNFIAK